MILKHAFFIHLCDLWVLYSQLVEIFQYFVVLRFDFCLETCGVGGQFYRGSLQWRKRRKTYLNLRLEFLVCNFKAWLVSCFELIVLSYWISTKFNRAGTLLNVSSWLLVGPYRGTFSSHWKSIIPKIDDYFMFGRWAISPRKNWAIRLVCKCIFRLLPS